MIEMFRIVSAQIRGLNFQTKPAATTACDTFSLFPRRVSFSPAHGLREGILNPNICISSTCELPVFTDHTHSSWHPLSHPPAQHSSMSPQRCSMGVSHCWRTASQWPQSSRATASGCVSTPTVRLHHCIPNPLAACKRERTLWGKVLEDGRRRCWSGAGRRNHWTNSSGGKGRGVRPQELQ